MRSSCGFYEKAYHHWEAQHKSKELLHQQFGQVWHVLEVRLVQSLELEHSPETNVKKNIHFKERAGLEPSVIWPCA